MVLFFIATLIVSILGMTALISFKRYELASGKIILASVRPAVGTFCKHALWWVEKVLPALVRVYGRRAFRYVKVTLQQGIAHGILWVEHTLEHILHTVREQTTAPRAQGEASAFLREVAEHKRKLSRRVKKERPVILEAVREAAVQKSELEIE